MEGKNVLKSYKKQVAQYKIHIKEGLDEFGKEVVDCIF